MQVPTHMENADPRLVGFHDMKLAGWFDEDGGDLAPGFPVTADDVVVDVGCGEGGIATFCGRRGAHVVLCDLNPDRVEKAVASLADTPARKVEGHVADGAHLPLADGFATRIICTEVLEHVDDPAETLAEIARIAAPGALVLLTVPGAAQEHVQKVVAIPGYFEKPNHIRILTTEALAALVEAAGLVVERTGGDGFYWSVYYAMFWQFSGHLGARNPALDRWAKIWLRIVQGRDGLKIKAALDAVLPRRTTLIARKP